jgi:hypothetical protein
VESFVAKKKPRINENKDLLELGSKVRAGALLSGYLRAIATEFTEVVEEDVPKGCPPGLPRLVSKAERLARWLWHQALPHKDDEGNEVKPDLRVVQIVLERIEGKAGTIEQERNPNHETVPDKISRINADRINRISAEVTGDGE